ncbi:MAG: hypothetical protein AAGN66_08690 [Acidobacteriota bacterium]
MTAAPRPLGSKTPRLDLALALPLASTGCYPALDLAPRWIGGETLCLVAHDLSHGVHALAAGPVGVIGELVSGLLR